jgi:putative flippase GtrA
MGVGPSRRTGRRWPERVGDFLTSWADWLPARVRPLLPRELVGFAILGAFTLSVDLTLLVLLRRWTRLPLPVAVSISYVCAVALNYVLNRTINFRSRAPVGGEAIRYAVVMLGDYLFTVGVSTGLTAMGLDFRIARLIASFIVAIFLYAASRWWVFRNRLTPPGPDVASPGSIGEASPGSDGETPPSAIRKTPPRSDGKTPPSAIGEGPPAAAGEGLVVPPGITGV